jgi:carboxypeptidase Taq
MTGEPERAAAPDPLSALRRRLATVADLEATLAILEWDQQTQMPETASGLRAEQMATLSRIAHEHAVDPEIGALLDRLEGEVDPETVDGALVRVARRDHDLSVCLPVTLVEETARATALAEPAWVQARARSDWSHFAPHLERIVDLRRQAAEAYGYDEHPLDPLIDLHEPGMTRARLQEVFAPVAERQAAMVQAVQESEAGAGDDRDALLHGPFDEAVQESFGRSVVGRFGYDWTRGRQDRAVHPFCTSFGVDDVRITTRFEPDYLPTALFGTLHEAGHGVYEQGIDPELARTPLADGVSMGVHESQSRLWENLVGRSRPFWRAFYPKLREAFPDRLGAVDLETFYRAINRSAPTPIRVEADELTYNLHVFLRFEIEAKLIDGSLSVADVPRLWNELMDELLGIVPEDDAQGALQDIHWSGGAFGYFPTYAVGNILSVQLYRAAVAEHPEIEDEMERGEFETLYGWLRDHVYRHGRRYDPDELITRATGRTLDPEPYLEYLETKYGELYGF